MTDMDLYKQAKDEMRDLAEEVMEQCHDFADDHNYEREWVVEQFYSAFRSLMRKA